MAGRGLKPKSAFDGRSLREGLPAAVRRESVRGLLLKKNDMTVALILGASFEIFRDYNELWRKC